ncbi:hypothetical protein H072_10176 [Dactylellina haptotyla CBS 200.50]|uniref:lytic cellulose monooxygenase (C4-dehydrogenating) n=1 Tax=Dactylellina haptotyla (strain CBS 200.50) TaxID=1284197 RepID=S8A5E6_DACHA|nr:hypothetical protein H072_10176 [Dactylellina haptotyla CBS 200.50]
MKTTGVFYFISAVSIIGAHWTHPLFTFNGQTSTEWQYVRLTTNRWTGDPLQDVSDNQMRCYHQAIPVTSTASVSAGSTVSFSVNSVIGHPGGLMFYMAKVPSGKTINSFDGSGNVWFKIYQDAPTYDSNGTPHWATLGATSVSVKIPSCIPAGDYLLRVEFIAVHGSSTLGGAQFYISCAQVKVTGGGSKNPTGLVSFPGAYSATDPGILYNLYNWPQVIYPSISLQFL